MHNPWQESFMECFLWRGSLLPLEGEALAIDLFGSASQPSGSKLPRHKGLAEVSEHA
ncbi:hypothetical protein ACVWYU_001321 [Pseudomonas sp. TE12234]